MQKPRKISRIGEVVKAVNELVDYVVSITPISTAKAKVSIGVKGATIKPIVGKNQNPLGDKELYKAIVLREWAANTTSSVFEIVPIGDENQATPNPSTLYPTWDFVRAHKPATE